MAASASSAAASSAALVSLTALRTSNSALSRASAAAASSTIPVSRAISVASCSICASSLRISVLAAFSSCSKASFAALRRPRTAAAIICSSRFGSRNPANSAAWRVNSEAFVAVSATCASQAFSASCAPASVSRAETQRLSQSKALYSWISPARRL